ncbi:polysaccharide deacetylase family protein [Aliarcobacter cibarius]|uniref:Polysaccharide deacetylase n=1 Tax=Aliarcobacter cibarius TaxID=255507 RepID=A0ABY2V565_9BACT|nr:polysaccharide deacetylase family protein [Aliarcobacter cibarius]TLT00206.1 polysaccharide deacetylase [Aliarcobacter cibarius]TLT00615.1 polysaccharide deacetylase [Aliarcobacter cibarius]TLT05112.1 polysaccharide deacetylase [Aliarcobacter cibarius]
MKYLLLLFFLPLYLLADAKVFVYHRFNDSEHQSTNTSLQELKTQFEYFKKNNYEVVALGKILNKLKNGEEIPSNWVALTIDDAYKSFYENGLNLFKEYAYPFTLFVYVEATNSKYNDFMTWDELREAKKYGDVELHSYSHKSLIKLSNQEIVEDTKKAIEIFEKNMGYKAKIYSYPFGEYDDRVQSEIKKFDFISILNQNNGSINSKSNIFDINRIALVGNVDIKEKIKYKTLEVEWIEPKEYPKDGILQTIKARVNPGIKEAKVFISTYNWQDVKVNNGIIEVKLNKKLNLNRSRVAISTDYYTISNKLLIK